MAKRSIFYKHPWLYILILRFVHWRIFSKRCQYMASFVENGATVLEPGCGPAIFANFIPKESHYLGFDINETFIKYAAKKYPGVYFGNVLNPESYQTADVVVACDIIHHLHPNDRKTFINLCFQSAKKFLIICEEGLDENKKKGVFYSYNKLLFEYFDRDGLNELKFENVWSKEFLRNEMENGFGIIPATVKREITEMFGNFIAVYFIDANRESAIPG